MKKLAAFLVAFLLLGVAAQASQYDPVLPTSSPYPGLTMLSNINSAFQGFLTLNSGSSAPSYITADMLWADTANNLLKFTPDGTNWYPIGYFNGGWVVTSNGFKQIAVTATGGGGTYVVTYNPAPTALAVGQEYSFITNAPSVGADKVNFNGLGAITLEKQGGPNLAAGDLAAGAVVKCTYDGTGCQVTSQLSSANSGTVTSVGLSLSALGFTVTGSPVTGAGAGNLTASGGQLNVANGGTGDSGYSAHQVLMSTAGTDVTGKTIPNCPDSGGQHLNYTQSGDTWACGTSGGATSGLIFITTVNCSSGCSSASFNSTYLTSTYLEYEIVGVGIYSSDGQCVGLQVSSNNGSSWQIGSYSGNALGGGALGVSGSTSSASFVVGHTTLDFYGMGQSVRPVFSWHTNIAGADGTGGGSNTAGTTTNYNALKLYDANCSNGGTAGTLFGIFTLFGKAH